MSSAECSTEFIIEQETVEEEKLGVSEQTIVQREDRQLDIIWKPQITIHTTDIPEQHVCKEEEVLADQQPCYQERSSSPDQGDPEPPEIKEEQEELIISFDQEELGPPQIKEEQEELCTSQEKEQLVLKQETDTLTVTPAYEESDQSEPEPNSEQLLSHNSPVAESPHQDGSNHVPIGDLDIKLEQRAKIQCCVKLGMSAKETLKILQKAYGKEAMSRSRCFVWHSRFKMGRTSLDDDDRPGRPSTSTTPENVQEIEEIVRQDRRLTIKEIAHMVNMSFGTVQAILTSNLNLHRVAAKFVPRLLTPEQKQQRVKVCDDLRQQAQDDPTFMSRIITGEEIWVYDYHTETKQQSPRPKKARQVKSATKIMVVVFFDIHGVVHHEFVPQGQTVTTEFYCSVLKHLRESIHQKRPKLWRDGNWVLHHEDTPAHSALETQELFANTNTIVVPHPPYSPDLSPCDFFLFPKMKFKLKCHHCDTVEEIQHVSQVVLETLKKRDFQRAFQMWQERWERCIAAQGDYFDGDGGQI
ncbi:histone-lysine N-methyltransferase SETMAR-like isoform X2 [Stegastes partitus]|uniref:Histone-lysine N-methyltransferase SETMAR-like isoform X2 n=1 Tax=Stegastes partitus TaxID=144197 RepID=A0A9Y4NBX4_9TELE|nr:PREDICTED: histone-lysine N-methyltransferase SETMAR-like isoform X2 [Stegastes partitus]